MCSLEIRKKKSICIPTVMKKSPATDPEGDQIGFSLMLVFGLGDQHPRDKRPQRIRKSEHMGGE